MNSFLNNKECFIHLRSHSSYSLSIGAIQITTLINLALEDNQPALAMTDINNMFGALEFSSIALEKGLQPIIGSQIILKDDIGSGEIVLLAKDKIGYNNLTKLISNAHLQPIPSIGPAIELDFLRKNHQGLIILTGGIKKGYIPEQIKNNQIEKAKKRLKVLKDIFSDNLYIELQRHNLPEQKSIENHLIDWALKEIIPLVATNDIYFSNPSMKEAHDVLLCIEEGKTISHPDRPSMTEHHYFKTSKQMIEIFSDIPEAINNTINIAKRCSVCSPFNPPILPAFQTSEGRDEKEELKVKSIKGLKERIENLNFESPEEQKDYFDRTNMELEIICDMGFAGYYLIVADVVNWAKKQNIPVGPGRGSGAGSIVAWSLKITDLDPLRWGLLFERFLNPDRISMPDFDIDFCKSRRDEVINYVQKRYGTNRVAQIITFGKLKARAVLRDTGRVLEMPYGQVDKIAKLIPNNPSNPFTISQALEEVEELKFQQKHDDQVSTLISISKLLEGLYRHASTHAAGVVIGNKDISEIVPLYKDPKSEMPATQFNMDWVEKAGLVKFDFLGLQTLTLIDQTLKLININEVKLDISLIKLNDKETFEMLSSGQTLGVFQLESAGMREVLKRMKPDRFEDLMAVVALYRPGPMDNIPKYISRKHGLEKVEFMHLDLKPILKETHGILIYQEQVMQTAQILSGYSMGAADILRKAMGKKIKSEMDAQRERFVEGAKNNSIKSSLANSIFDQISAFAGYGFNKSHAAGYAMISYQTAWLRAHYPHEFFSACMSLEINDTDKLFEFILEVKSQNIELSLPSINSSGVYFEVKFKEDKKYIEYGLSAIKNIGVNAINDLIEERNNNGMFESIEDFARRIPSSILNKRMLENLINAGSLDCINKNRNILISGLDNILSFADMNKRESLSQQTSLFLNDEKETLKIRLKVVEEPSLSMKLKNEFNSLGFYLSSHPTELYNSFYEKLNVIKSDEILKEINKNAKFCKLSLVGVVNNKFIRTTKRGGKFHVIYMTDNKGSFDFVVFDELFYDSEDLINSDKPLLITVEAKIGHDGRIRLSALEIKDLENVITNIPEVLSFQINNISNLEKFKNVLNKFPEGKSRIKLFIQKNTQEFEINLDQGYLITPSDKNYFNKIPGIKLIH